MKKKVFTGLLVVSHILCVLLGYCIAKLDPASKEMELNKDHPISTVTAEIVETMQEAEIEEPMDEIVETEETTKPTEKIEEDKPVYTQPTNDQPQITTPQATEAPANDTTEQLPVDAYLGENETPPAIRGD